MRPASSRSGDGARRREERDDLADLRSVLTVPAAEVLTLEAWHHPDIGNSELPSEDLSKQWVRPDAGHPGLNVLGVLLHKGLVSLDLVAQDGTPPASG